MFGSTFSRSAATQEDVEMLREDATQTARDIIVGVEENFLTQEEFNRFQNHMDERIKNLTTINNNILELLDTIGKRMNLHNEELPDSNIQSDRATTPKPGLQERFATPGPESESDDNSTHYDLDHDVIMKSRFAYTVNQIEPGLFSGDTSQTDLFCQLCEDILSSYPNRFWPEDAKINYVKGRLRGAARSWFLIKYPGNLFPANVKELLDGLREAFSNVASYKLAKIKLAKIKQSYGKVDQYIEEFRSYTQQLNWNNEALVLFFYNGLHPRYQEEIEKDEIFPVTLESIITKCILFETSLNTKNKIRQVSGNKNNKEKKFNHRRNSNFRNRNFNNYNNNNNNYNNYNNKFNNNKYNNNDNNNIKVQKINSKN